jgi:hypothetical protein
MPSEDIDIQCIRTLLLSVLRRAMDDWALYQNATAKKQRRLRDEARVWLFEDVPTKNELDTFMSCRNICAILDLSIISVRERAMERSKEDVRKISFND